MLSSIIEGPEKTTLYGGVEWKIAMGPHHHHHHHHRIHDGIPFFFFLATPLLVFRIRLGGSLEKPELMPFGH
jgi:hypothetical protein